MSRLEISAFVVSALFQALLCAPVAAAPGSPSPISLKVDPSEIGVDLFYSGTAVHAEGVIPAGYGAAIICRGQERAVDLKRKGKVFRILWMNVADVVLEDVPALYLLSTSSALAELAPLPVLRELGVGYEALEARALRSSGQNASADDFREFLKLKESEQLYSVDEGGVKVESGPNGAMRVSAGCLLPTKAPWGEYEVALFGFKEGQGHLLRSERLRLAPAGVTASISTLAEHHGLLYGVLAVLIALGVGVVTGLAFGLVPKKGH